MTITRINPASTYTRVKGNSESSYRTGDVNLTPANIGAPTLAGSNTYGQGYQTIQFASVDNTRNDNGISATAITGLEFTDKNGLYTAFVDGRAETDGRSAIYIVARKNHSESSSTTHGVYMGVDNNGGRSVWFTEVAPWLSALGLDGVGAYYYKDNSSGTSVPSSASAVTNIASITVPAGTYLILFKANIANSGNAVGIRSIAIGVGSTSPNWRYTGVQLPPINGAKIYLATSYITVLSSQTTIYGLAQQNSGAALNVTGLIQAVRIK
jgi:hypothetical protein